MYQKHRQTWETTFARDFSRLLRARGIKARAIRNHNYGDYTAVYMDENFKDVEFHKAKDEFIELHGEGPHFDLFK